MVIVKTIQTSNLEAPRDCKDGLTRNGLPGPEKPGPPYGHARNYPDLGGARDLANASTRYSATRPGKPDLIDPRWS